MDENKGQITIKSCSTCGRVLEVNPPGSDLRITDNPLKGVAYQKLSNPNLLVGTYNKPLRLNFLHIFAEVECPECGDKASIEVRV